MPEPSAPSASPLPPPPPAPSPPRPGAPGPVPAPARSSRFRKRAPELTIELQLNSLAQLFNSFDPSPFHLKDLDDDAEAYIVATARELPLHEGTPLQLILYLPPEAAAEANVPEVNWAIYNYFDYRERMVARELRQKLRTGRISLLIGLGALFACITARQLLLKFLSHPDAWSALTEGLTIVGWVSLWGPIQIFLYEWWPISATRRLYARLKRMGLVVRPLRGGAGT